MTKIILKSLAIVASVAVAVSANAQVVLTKTLPPIGTTYENWGNFSLPASTVVPDTGANVSWDYSTITVTKTYDYIIQPLSAVPTAEQTFASAAGAVYAEEILAFTSNPEWNARDYYKDDGDYLIKVAAKGMATSPIQSASDTLFKFNVPYQSTANLKLSNQSGLVAPFRYAGYGTLIIGSETYNDVVLFKEDVTTDSLYYFFTVTPHYHKLARIRFNNGQRQILYWKPTGTAPTAPAAPSNLTVTPVNSMDLNWQDNSSNEDGFYIESTQDTIAGTWTQIASVSADVTYYHHTGLNPGEDYFYRVRAYNANGNSAYSNIAGATEIATGIGETFTENTLLVYPNPANEMVTIGNLPSGSILNITDITGKVVYNAVIKNEQTTINTTDFVNGVYILQVNNNGSIATTKFVVNK